MAGAEVVIIPYRDGPYLVRGPVTLRDQDGRPIESERRTIALCRCGKSRLRPFCDGSHHVIRFRAPSEREARGSEATGSAPATAPRSAPGDLMAFNATPRPGSAKLARTVERDLARAQAALARLRDERAGEEEEGNLPEAAALLAAAAALLRDDIPDDGPAVRAAP